ncbi:MAG: T9SS type A sorting domain-containing protein [Candidatus Sabulitectum sp.]|nr:T9SS type A sorting domain-containing protein [Candidatus Sabulitectum sp.]
MAISLRFLMIPVLALSSGLALGNVSFDLLPLLDDASDTWQRLTPPLSDAPVTCSMLLDQDGWPMICYDPAIASGPDGLFFIRYDGAQWLETMIDSLYLSSAAGCMEISSDGFPVILYGDYYNTALKFAWLDGTGWNVETVFTDLGNSYEMALSSQGIPHISFTDKSDNNVYYAVRGAGGWSIEMIGSATTWPTIIALDQYDLPHIVFEASVPLLHYWYDGLVWQSETVTTYQYTEDLAMCFDNQENLHLIAQESGGLYYYVKTDTVWLEEAVDSYSGDECSIAVGSDGTIHVAYDDSYNSDLRYARKILFSTWETQVVTWEGYNAFSPSIDLDSLGNPYIFHSQFSSSELVWWGSGPLGNHTVSSIQIPNAGYMRISPNPALSEAELHLNIEWEGDYQLLVFDLSGRRINYGFCEHFSPGEYDLPITLNDIPGGIYIFMLKDDRTSMYERVVVLD